jgi:four helix bundle suffix protein
VKERVRHGKNGKSGNDHSHETRPPDVLANIAICLINQATYLIDRHLASLEKAFIEQGGLREKMTRIRLEYRQGQHRYQPNSSHSSHKSHATPEKKREQRS